jgi:hypothetical protein
VAQQKIAETKRLSREIRKLRFKYNQLRSKYIDQKHRENEQENMYVFEDAVAHLQKTFCLNVKRDLLDEYPDLSADAMNLLLAVYECRMLLDALLDYCERWRKRIEAKIKCHVGRILPQQMYTLGKLLPLYVGNCPTSDKFNQLYNTYVKTFSNQIGIIQLTDNENRTTN